MGAFKGFPKGGAAFFAELAKKQDRDWFKANKERYEELWEEPMKALMGELQQKLEKSFPSIADTKPKVMRIYRDVRFSKDKSPYKTNIGAWIGFAKSEHAPGLYVHGDAKQHFVAAGTWMMEPPVLKAFREAVAGDEGKLLEKDLKKVLAKGFEVHSHDRLKRVPAPYAPDHPRAELLKEKGFALTYPKVPAGLPATPKYADWIVTQTRAAAPVLDWLQTTLG